MVFLPAGMVLTGGQVLCLYAESGEQNTRVPVRIAQPENLVGMTDRLNSPAFSTSVGLLRWVINERGCISGRTRSTCMKIGQRGSNGRA